MLGGRIADPTLGLGEPIDERYGGDERDAIIFVIRKAWAQYCDGGRGSSHRVPM